MKKIKDIFYIRRVILLLKRYFLENLSREIMFWCIITFIFTVLDSRIFVLIVLFVSGLIYSIRLHNDLLKGAKGIHYLLIPATHGEKLVASIILNTIYHFAMTILAYSIGNLLVTLTYHYLLKMAVPVNWDLFQETSTVVIDGFYVPDVKNVFWSVFGLFGFSQALFMLGSIYFKNNIVFKTIFSLFAIGFVVVIVQLVMFKTLWHVKHLANTILPVFVIITDATIPTIIKNVAVIGSYLFIPILWTISYFSLTEKEV